MNNDLHLYGWLFSYNPYKDIWIAFKREELQEAFNNFDSDKVLKCKGIDNVKVLVEIIGRTNGDEIKIKALLGAGEVPVEA